MSSRKLDKIATDIDDASIVVDELQDAPKKDTKEKLDELQNTLDHAANTIDKLTDKNEGHDAQ